MPTLHLSTRIKAPIERVFDLSRSIDAHIASTSPTKEKAIAGKTSGLIELGERVTWEAFHLPVKQSLCVEITQMESPHSFTDELVSGPFHSMKHVHLFKGKGNFTFMDDEFHYSTGRGIFGQFIENSFLSAYLRRFLRDRNTALKEFAEGEQWREFLPNESLDH